MRALSLRQTDPNIVSRILPFFAGDTVFGVGKYAAGPDTMRRLDRQEEYVRRKRPLRGNRGSSVGLYVCIMLRYLLAWTSFLPVSPCRGDVSSTHSPLFVPRSYRASPAMMSRGVFSPCPASELCCGIFNRSLPVSRDRHGCILGIRYPDAGHFYRSRRHSARSPQLFL